MKIFRVILILLAIAALAFGVVATSRLGALQSQVSDLSARLETALVDAKLAEEVTTATENALENVKGELARANEQLERRSAPGQTQAPADDVQGEAQVPSADTPEPSAA